MCKLNTSDSQKELNAQSTVLAFGPAFMSPSFGWLLRVIQLSCSLSTEWRAGSLCSAFMKWVLLDKMQFEVLRTYELGGFLQ